MRLIYLALFYCISVYACCAQRAFKTLETPNNERRLALVIGNAAYSGNALANPINDARAVRDALRRLGFTVQYYENVGKTNMEEALIQFTKDLNRHNVGLFYFAGHGFESKDKVNYLMSTDITSSTNEVLAKEKSLNLDAVIESMRIANSHTNLLVIDACRNNPFRAWNRDGTQGLATVSPPAGTVVFFASSPGQTADDNRGGKNGLFTEEFLQQLETPNLELTQVLKNTGRAVYRRSGNQLPAITGTLLDDFYFTHTAITNNMPEPVPTPKREEPAPKSQSADMELHQMVYVEGGSFMMGDNNGLDAEKPVTKIRLSSFRISAHETTVAQFRRYCEESSRTMPQQPDWSSDDHPVINVSWDDAMGYCEWLTRKTGLKHRLPTEAEWEYAARGGKKSLNTQYAGSSALDDVGWYKNNSQSKAHPVGKKRPNELGLYDMSGNAREWCSDWYYSLWPRFHLQYHKKNPVNTEKVFEWSMHSLRGGSWYCHDLRLSDRYYNNEAYKYEKSNNVDIGFRVVATSL
ncbi:SUMF1/EgtB/PvdO family nonheme iron enzyme [Runella sp. MFBS21]|uniref:SUMF1/EgtB/PvdO family nonheme iron enzyme n=1 Tax=Runella sp. MFBS21 TaxID=3034018 RepID=UPI0023F86C8F|nr:SUMF1/EgtB/PvdO family nonheme iron enzyme [Runella sp. MFBS21]MDF7821817.1 SUMF1/EgtB/PvdO family nonheme iron enzyme [Runella sp. MFBS21]